MDLGEVWQKISAVNRWHVKSSSDPRKLYLVEEMSNGSLRCDCVGFLMHQRQRDFECKHIKRVKQFVENGKK